MEGRRQKRTLIIGIDPGTSSSSNTGFVAFDASSGELVYALEVGSNRGKLRFRLADISNTVSSILLELSASGAQCSAFIEQFVMRGKGGEALQRLIGAIMATCPDEVALEHVQNSTVKKVMAGHGQADKASVAIGVLEFFEKELPNKKTIEYIKQLIRCKQFDILDALAIGVSGWKEQGSNGRKQKT